MTNQRTEARTSLLVACLLGLGFVLWTLLVLGTYFGVRALLAAGGVRGDALDVAGLFTILGAFAWAGALVGVGHAVMQGGE